MQNTSPSPTKKVQNHKLPKPIRDELKMTVALKGFATLKEGNGKTLVHQWDTIGRFYHGKDKTHPSQLKMMCEGTFCYRDFYETKISTATDKDSSSASNTSSLVLKQSLTLDKFRSYYAGVDITYLDLEKKNLLPSCNLLVTGRSLHNLAKKGLANYRKANSFAVQMWDEKKGEPKESGHTQDDVVKFVRTEMYKLLKPNSKLKDPLQLDEELDQAEENFEEVEEDDDDDNGKNVEDKDDEISCPDDYIFPGFMAFIVWGPFAEPNDRLSLFDTSDASTGKAKSRAEKRSAEQMIKNEVRSNDTVNERGYTVDQRISYESLKLQKQAQVHVQDERTMIGLVAIENSLCKQVESAERRATVRCKEYDSNNIHWKRVDDLIEEHNEAIKNLKEFVNEKNNRKEADDDECKSIEQLMDGKSNNTPSTVNKTTITIAGKSNEKDNDNESVSDITENNIVS